MNSHRFGNQPFKPRHSATDFTGGPWRKLPRHTLLCTTANSSSNGRVGSKCERHGEHNRSVFPPRATVERTKQEVRIGPTTRLTHPTMWAAGGKLTATSTHPAWQFARKCSLTVGLKMGTINSPPVYVSNLFRPAKGTWHDKSIYDGTIRQSDPAMEASRTGDARGHGRADRRGARRRRSPSGAS